MNKKTDLRKIEKMSKALGDPYRLKIMELIRKEKDWIQCTAIAEMFDLAQSTVSHHLKQLVDAELLVATKDGRNTNYIVNKEALAEYMNFMSRLAE